MPIVLKGTLFFKNCISNWLGSSLKMCRRDRYTSSSKVGGSRPRTNRDPDIGIDRFTIAA